MSTVTAEATYKSIPGSPGYRVGDDGSAWSCVEQLHPRGIKGGTVVRIGTKWRRLSPRIDEAGRPCLNLPRFAVRKQVRICRLVLEAFVGPCPSGMECCHNDGNPANNALSNLRWDTRRANRADQVKHGTDLSGERHGRAKLTEGQVKEIRALLKQRASHKEIAAQYGVRRTTIGWIARGKTWRNV